MNKRDAHSEEKADEATVDAETTVGEIEEAATDKEDTSSFTFPREFPIIFF
jgi:hypothetical protein